MTETDFTKRLDDAAEYLKQHDPILAPVILTHGRCTYSPHQNYYQALVNSIIGQQLSVKAAASIRKRFYELFPGDELPEAQQILEKSVEQLRAVGFSNAKARYVQDLALHILEGKLKFDTIDSKTNEEITAELTAVKGVGEWTAHMFLMFTMGRLDVLPIGDLGIRNGIRKLYGLTDAPTPTEITELAKNNGWHPYESVASWYIWRSLDNEPK